MRVNRGNRTSVRPVSCGEMWNIRMMPNTATTVERSATEMLEVPALFMSRVSSLSRFISSPVRTRSKNPSSVVAAESTR